ncbi:MAG TPA: hypothetical protein IAC73_05230 [Candidatus Limadaptatus stercoripullorum]|uniref:Uncharacterized protein n=1 Tax=Candidatus Limadaptatus stercoripullorum TaxID=2840846 RepID=A0A9D1NAC2_9FIRM|nr:hypothetical protein [Candidatus Limadaptatus stercoripullorum]
MKTAAKVFNILSMIFGFYMIYPLVLGIIANKKLNECKDIKSIHNWGIVVLLFVNLISGIIMLVMKEDDLYDSPEEAAAAAALKQQQAMGYGAYPPAGYDAYGGYHDGFGGYYDAAGGYYDPYGNYYPPAAPPANGEK